MQDVCFIFIPKLWDMIQCDLHMYLFKFRLKQRIGQTHLVASTWPKILKTCRSVHEKTTFMVNSGWIVSLFFFCQEVTSWPTSTGDSLSHRKLVIICWYTWCSWNGGPRDCTCKAGGDIGGGTLKSYKPILASSKNHDYAPRKLRATRIWKGAQQTPWTFRCKGFFVSRGEN